MPELCLEEEQQQLAKEVKREYIPYRIRKPFGDSKLNAHLP